MNAAYIRSCALGVQSCFYVTGTYKDIGNSK
jgi:hypothetical protein